MATRTLNVEVIGASGLKDTEFIGKSDPYVVLSIGKEQRKSKVAKDQPETPVWNETLSLPVVDTDADVELLIRILNDDRLGRDEEMGRVVIPVSLVYGGGYSASIFPLELKGKPHGEIQLSLSFEGEDYQGHREEHHGLTEKVEGLYVGEKEHGHGEGHEAPHEGIKEKLQGKLQGLKERKHRKKEKKNKGSGDEGSSSSSSESEKEG